MYAPRGASVPGASVPGRGHGGRSFSAAVPDPSPIGLSPSAPPRGPEERRGEPHVPRRRSFGTGDPAQSHVAAEPPPTSHDSPPTCSRRNSGSERGSSHVGPAVSDYVPGDPPLQWGKKKKKARARAEWLEGREPRGARAQAPRTRAHACPCLADVAPRAQEFPGSPDFFRVLDPEWRGSGSPQGQGGESRPAGTPE